MEKMPRHYARAFMRAGDNKERQRLALEGCPVEWRELVKKHIEIARGLKK